MYGIKLKANIVCPCDAIATDKRLYATPYCNSARPTPRNMGGKLTHFSNTKDQI